jgi:hypothetical protein
VATPAPNRTKTGCGVFVGLIILIAIISAAVNGGNKTSTATETTTSAPPIQVTVPGDLVGKNAQLADDELHRLGITNVSYASQDAGSTMVLLLRNWTVTRVEPAPGTVMSSADRIVVTATKKPGAAAGGSSLAGSQTSAEPPAATGPVRSFGPGTYVVGTDIVAGTYKTTGSSSSVPCYWARLRNTSGEFSAIIANGDPSGPTTVTISKSDGAFETSGCNTWQKVG